eukprot:gene49594-28792_t
MVVRCAASNTTTHHGGALRCVEGPVDAERSLALAAHSPSYGASRRPGGAGVVVDVCRAPPRAPLCAVTPYDGAQTLLPPLALPRRGL